MPVKLLSCDTWFSKCVRERVNWHCERCGSYFPEGHDRRGLHCSHYFGRGNWSTRFHPDNAFSHCYGCHQYLGSNPSLFKEWVIERLGEGRLEIVKDIKNDKSLGRYAKRSKREIARHYRQQHEAMHYQRINGCTDRIDFECWL